MKISFNSHDSEAFSLIELLVIMAIIAILSVAAVPLYRNYISRANMAKAMENNYILQKLAQDYYSDHGLWPLPADINVTSDGTGISPYIYSLGLDSTRMGQCDVGVIAVYMQNFDGYAWDPSKDKFLPAAFMFSIYPPSKVVQHLCTYMDQSGISPIRTVSDLIANCQFVPNNENPYGPLQDLTDQLGC